MGVDFTAHIGKSNIEFAELSFNACSKSIWPLPSVQMKVDQHSWPQKDHGQLVTWEIPSLQVFLLSPRRRDPHLLAHADAVPSAGEERQLELHLLHSAPRKHENIWLWLKNPVPKWNPGKWKHGPKLAYPLLFNFEPHPYPLAIDSNLKSNKGKGKKRGENKKNRFISANGSGLPAPAAKISNAVETCLTQVTFGSRDPFGSRALYGRNVSHQDPPATIKTSGTHTHAVAPVAQSKWQKIEIEWKNQDKNGTRTCVPVQSISFEARKRSGHSRMPLS